jgi:hypothetical protein
LELPPRFAVGFLGRVFAEELAPDRDRRFVAGPRLDALLRTRLLAKRFMAGVGGYAAAPATYCSPKEGGPSGGSAPLQLANDALELRGRTLEARDCAFVRRQGDTIAVRIIQVSRRSSPTRSNAARVLGCRRISYRRHQAFMGLISASANRAYN